MSDCCPILDSTVSVNVTRCPQDGSIGKPVQLITLKSLLTPEALERLDAQASYRFCSSPNCSTVYISSSGQVFTVTDLKVPVFQKDAENDVPVCYCFGWTGRRIQEEIEQIGTSTASVSITTHIKAKRCGCEVNNPQGHCCLANVQAVIESLILSQIQS